MITEIVEYKTLQKVRELFDKTYDQKFIFRGQSNGFSNLNENWGLTSSFKRYYNNQEVSFNTFILNNLDRGKFNLYFSKYKYPNSSLISQSPFIEKLYYLQHYGIPTCLLDFSKDPIIALYFALSTLKIPSVRQFNDNGYKSLGDQRYVTVYQLDTSQLKEHFQVKEIVDRDFCWDYDQFVLPFSTQSYIKMAIDLNPLDKLKSLDNYNLENQNGCFVLYDNTESVNDIPLEETLTHINQDHLKMKFNDPVIIKHNFYLDQLIKPRDSESLFSYVRDEKGVTGQSLFNDIQGIKYDLLQIHDTW
jgi:hypothetical protein